MLGRLAQGYLRIGRALVLLIGWIVVLALLSAVLTLPVWWIAARAPELFTGLALTCLVGAAFWLVVSRIRQSQRPRRVLAGLVPLAALIVGLLAGQLWLVVPAALVATVFLALHVAR